MSGKLCAFLFAIPACLVFRLDASRFTLPTTGLAETLPTSVFNLPTAGLAKSPPMAGLAETGSVVNSVEVVGGGAPGDRTSTVANADFLLCGLGANGAAAREKKCAAKCINAMEVTKLPPFPQGFFGGLSKKERDRGDSPIADVAGEMMSDKIVLDAQDDFVFPMKMAAYFSCYTRSKWPLFNAWVVAPELQKEDKVARSGHFGNVHKKTDEYESFHGKYKGEFLRSGDVKGVWSDYYGFDQGHWAPDAAFRSNNDLVKSTYYYINVSPQTACLNRQEWEHLESNIRDFSVSEKRKISVMSGPLELLPSFFLSTPAMKKKWTSVLELWRVASEVLMRGVDTANGMKDPHWVEVTEHTTEASGSHCMLRGDDASQAQHPDVTFGVQREELRDLAHIPSCRAQGLLKEGLGKYAFYLMMQAGKSAIRRGVRVPLAYWKVASWERQGKQVYCCYIMDQTGVVDMTDTGAACIAEIDNSFDVVPSGIVHAGTETCEALFSPRGGNDPENQQAQQTMDCDFGGNGIGWRGDYLLSENDIDH